MTPPKDEKRTGIEELRLAVQNFNVCSESFNERFTAEQLILLNRALLASGWDIYPDHWTPRQIREALRGIPPQFDDSTEKPMYSSHERTITRTPKLGKRRGSRKATGK